MRVHPHAIPPGQARKSIILTGPEVRATDKGVKPKEDTSKKGEVALQAVEADPTEDRGKLKGVLRNLLAGHFKGVADLRLRINFHEELSSIQQLATDKVVDSEVASILQNVNDSVDAFLAQEDLDTEIAQSVAGHLEAFFEAVNGFLSPAEDGSRLPVSDLLSGFQSAFDQFEAALRELFQPAETQETEPAGPALLVDGEEVTGLSAEGHTAPAETTLPNESPVSAFDQFLTSLREVFSHSLQSFESALSEAQTILPELSEPYGRGRAYGKFLVIYQQLYGINEDPAPERPSVDTTA